jgi:hypothetical protein
VDEAGGVMETNSKGKNMKQILVIALFALTAYGCTNKKGATEALKDAGFHPIEVGGWNPFLCGEHDLFSTQFTAYSPDSTRIVRGVVCEGVFKGKTIRTK